MTVALSAMADVARKSLVVLDTVLRLCFTEGSLASVETAFPALMVLVRDGVCGGLEIRPR